MKKGINKILAAVFVFSWFAILAIAGSMEQAYISLTQGIVYCIVAFVALGVSGFLSGMLTVPDERSRK